MTSNYINVPIITIKNNWVCYLVYYILLFINHSPGKIAKQFSQLQLCIVGNFSVVHLNEHESVWKQEHLLISWQQAFEELMEPLSTCPDEHLSASLF